MVLVDTSVWSGHFRVANLPLVRLLKETRVVVHPFVIGELACGHLARRHEVLALMGKLPRAVVRPPLMKLSSQEIERIRAALVAAGLLEQQTSQRRVA